MNSKLFLLLALVFPMFLAASCSGDAEGGLDTAKITAEASESLSKLTSGLGDMVSMDAANIDGIKEKVNGLMESATNLQGLKEKLGDKMPSLAGLQGAIDGLKAKFGSNDAIMNIVNPLIEKLKALMGN